METNVGGQALIEGVMMKSRHSVAIAVRHPNGNVLIKKEPYRPLGDRLRLFKLPFFRGPVVLTETLINGIRALNYSASVALEDETSTNSWALALALIAGIGFALIFFVVLPHYLSYLLGHHGPFPFDIDSGLFHLVDGYFKISFFLAYIVIISLFGDIRRVFEYHGAEHKSIYAYESGEELSVESAKKFSTLHPRCGTAFILIVLVLSIFVFTGFFIYVPQPHIESSLLKNLFNVTLKVLLFVPLSGLAYEFIRFSGKHADKKTLRWAIIPGLWLQKLTTREPDDQQLEVALEALRAAIGLEEIQTTSHT